MKKIIALLLTLSSIIFADGYETFYIDALMFRGNGSVEVGKTTGNFTAAPDLPDRAYILATVDPDIRKQLIAALLVAKTNGNKVECYIVNIDNKNVIRDIQVHQ